MEDKFDVEKYYLWLIIIHVKSINLRCINDRQWLDTCQKLQSYAEIINQDCVTIMQYRTKLRFLAAR
ncbi:hypothetical protein [Vibrio harveyi]|uniref:hypothetical protein n=1 Tax=Vibrio harveyi TaxID=669 RepID=UPI00217D13CF|nr:hypothetical protein [Vibrio harveyi]HEQ3589564.1 hypothetical protein [Vibrio harveyi]HEQ3598446.1 hypothetical protein [Vibrio harveyi]HEQ3610138.1 hypothetical protein [Vibrio harveyi]